MKIDILKEFKIPVIVLVGIILYLLLPFLGFPKIGVFIILTVIALGSYGLVLETISGLLKKNFVLDYIALVAVLVAILTNQYLVASIIALMIVSGEALDNYAFSKAKDALTKLVDRIPTEVILWKKDHLGNKIKLESVTVGQTVAIRKGEVIGLDGVLISQIGLTDESSLTGEPYEVEKFKGDNIRSGTINIGNLIVIQVTRTQKNSTYNKIIDLVKKAQTEKAPLVRLADKYSTVFTIVTAILCVLAYALTSDLNRVLAVLVVATPCPLLLATPIALLGGVNAAAKKRIIIKKLASLEVLSRLTALIFDKTGTITIGIPKVSDFVVNTKEFNKKELLAIAESIERNSLHPLAKAVVGYARAQQVSRTVANNIEEIIGQGISGEVNGKKYLLSKITSNEGMKIGLFQNKKELAQIHFEDQIKKESRSIISQFKHMGFKLFIFTGDKKAAAEKVIKQLGEDIEIKAECTPAEKSAGIEALQKNRNIVAMVGDGINDAPALALADVGMVFSNEEQTAASEAADIVFLGGDFEHVSNVSSIAKKTIYIAKPSILVGMGLSLGAMVLATVGVIPPLIGAGIQEAIDISVILNALRASR